MLIFVTYEAPPDGEDRTAAFQQVIDQFAAGRHFQPFTNRWLIETDESLDIWLNRFGSPGRYLIFRVQERPTGVLPVDSWDWIKAVI